MRKEVIAALVVSGILIAIMFSILISVRNVQKVSLQPAVCDNDGVCEQGETVESCPQDCDTDGDGLPDAWEIQYFENLTQNATQDFDLDGLTNVGEYQANTNPTIQDTDSDGLVDSFEVIVYGTNPLITDSDNDAYSDNYEATRGSDPLNYSNNPEQCHDNSDPQGLADGVHAIFIDQNNCNCISSWNRAAALNPATPLCSPKLLHEGYEYGSEYNQKLQPGDTVYIREGNYITNLQVGTNYWSGGYVDYSYGNRYPVIKTSGTPVNPIKIKSYPGERAVIRGGRQDKNTSDPFLLKLAGADHVKINDIDFLGYVDGAQGRLYMSSLLQVRDQFPSEVPIEGIDIMNSSFLHAFGSDDIFYDQYVAMNQATGFLLHGYLLHLLNTNNSIVNQVEIGCTDSPEHGSPPGGPKIIEGDGLTCDYCDNVAVRDSQFFICGHDDLHTHYSQNMVIENNEFNNLFHNGIDFNWGGNNTIRNNIFHDWNLYPSETSLAADAIEILGSSDNLIYNNIIYNSAYYGRAIEISARINERADRNQIYHNLIYNTGATGILLANWLGLSGGNVVANNKIYNNVIYGMNDPDTDYIFHGLIHIRFNQFAENNGYGNEIKNNIVMNYDDEDPANDIAVSEVEITDPEGDGLHRVNFTLSQAEARYGSAFSNNLALNPLLTNPNSPELNFHLQENSPAIDAGICFPEVPEDFDGNPRLSGNSCDIGPFEYVQCGDGNCNSAESCSSCPSDCGSCPEDGGDNGGGGGGGNYIPVSTPQDLQCNSSWICTEWENCIIGTQNRSCFDQNNCGIVINRPSEERICLFGLDYGFDEEGVTTIPSGAKESSKTFFIITSGVIIVLVPIIILMVLLALRRIKQREKKRELFMSS